MKDRGQIGRREEPTTEAIWSHVFVPRPQPFEAAFSLQSSKVNLSRVKLFASTTFPLQTAFCCLPNPHFALLVHTGVP